MDESLFWAGKDKVHGGQCLVAWNTICKPLVYGGLGVKNLQLQALALRVRWEWLRRTDQLRPWQGLHMMVDEDARRVFDSLVSITVGKGDKVLFWRDRWIHGFAVKDIAPTLFQGVSVKVRNTRTVAQAIQGESWTLDVQLQFSFGALWQAMHLRHAVASVPRDEQEEDRFSWPHDRSGAYTAKSTYT